MKAARISGCIVCLLSLGTAAYAGITPISQKLDYTDNYNEYMMPESDPNRIVFIPPGGVIDDTQTEWPVLDHMPWHRLSTMDWGWTHDISDRIPPDVNGLQSATLTIEAWDVNPDPDPGDPFDQGPEIDEIRVNGTLVGNLDVTPVYDWGTTTFTLPFSILQDLWFDGQIYVHLNIDKLIGGHRVTLGSSTLTVNYYVSGPGRGATEPIFRFWSPTLSHHFFTTSESERDGVIHNYPDTWSDYEGTVYYLPADDSDPNVRPVYRFWSDALSSHFYTISEEDRNYVLNTYPDVWRLEGVVFYAYPPGLEPADSSPVYRFWSSQHGTHFYTISEDEKDYVIANYDVFWQYETIAWYAYQ